MDSLNDTLPLETLAPFAPPETEAVDHSVDHSIDEVSSEFINPELKIGTEEELQPEPVLTVMDQAEIQSSIEALLFISDKPLSLKKLHELLGPSFAPALFEEALTALLQRYQATYHGFEIVEVAGGFQFRTKPGRAHLAQKLVKIQTQRLSSGAMETLAIIAYRQPIMKEEIDKVRGVDSSHFVRMLIERKLVEISGRSELPGRPILYTTTPAFLELFGLKDRSALPSLREIEQMIPASQVGRPDDEDPRVREMRRMVNDMKLDPGANLDYDPKEDDKLLQEFREKIGAIPTSTPYLEELKAAEILEKQQALAAAAMPSGSQEAGDLNVS